MKLNNKKRQDVIKCLSLFIIVIVLVTFTGFIAVSCDIETNTNTSVRYVTVTGDSFIEKEQNKNYTATVTGNNNPEQYVTWSIDTNGIATGTTINQSGVLSIATDETVSSLIIRATSTVNNSKYGTKYVIIYNQGATPANWVKTEGPKILAHYMPWNIGPTYKSQEGNLNAYIGHWRGDDNWRNPTQIVDGDKSLIASREYPLTGPYDGRADHLLRYQNALMKLAGIDGVIICWYSCYTNIWDFGQNQTIATNMIRIMEEANQEFAIMLEDWPMNTDAAGMGYNMQGNVTWLRQNWFTKSNYIKVPNGKNLLFCFGPQHASTQSAVTANDIYFVSAAWYVGDWPDSKYPWPEPATNLSTQEHLTYNYNAASYANSLYKVASIWPQFWDCYKDSYPNTRYPVYQYDNGVLWQQTWEMAMATNPWAIQLVTWNDWGEGTVIEPSRERGYNELEFLQNRMREIDPSFPYTAEDLRYPLEIYKLEYNQTVNGRQDTIQAAYNALWNGNVAEWRARCTELGLEVSTSNLKPIRR